MWHWLLVNYLEILGTLTGLIYIVLSIRQKMALWLVGIVSSALYIAIFFNSQLYADMSLNIYYLIVSIYGWYHWHTNKSSKEQASISITTLAIKDWLLYLFIAGVFTAMFMIILKTIPQLVGWPPSALPFWDWLITAGSIVATWMLARKILEQWLWWIAIDALSGIVFYSKHLYFTSFLFMVYTILALVGFINWKKDYSRQ